MPEQSIASPSTTTRRHRADSPVGTVVFLLGMRINRLRSVRALMQVLHGMPQMMRESALHQDLGLRHSSSTWSGRSITLIQYWESMDKLMAYAAARDREHLPAWKRFNELMHRHAGAVGIWHEAYEVTPGRSHLIYNGMPPTGMGKATSWMPANSMPPQEIRSRLTGDE